MIIGVEESNWTQQKVDLPERQIQLKQERGTGQSIRFDEKMNDGGRAEREGEGSKEMVQRFG